MEKMLLIGVIGTLLCVWMHSLRPEFVLPIGVLTGILILTLILEQTSGLLTAVRELGARFGVSDVYQKAVLKMIGIAYLAQFGANLCRDAGQSSVAEKLELGGRVCVLTCALPAVVTLLETGTALLNGVLP